MAHALGQTCAAVTEINEPATEHAEVDEALALLRYSRRAMATHFEVFLPLGTARAHALASAALDEIDRLEAQLTVYRADSEVSWLNQQAGQQPVVVEQGLFDLLALAARLTHETEGAFDVATGKLIKAWGFFKGPPCVPTRADRLAALADSGMRHVVLNPADRTVRFLRQAVEINLGSIGKGYALDRAVDVCRSSFGLASGILHGGKSSVYAIGSAPGSDRGWPVEIGHPADPTHSLARIWLKNQALGTSAATYRHLEWQGRRLGHTLDPRTGWPAEGMLSASVIAPTAAEADALATAFFVMGVERSRAYCEKHPAIGALLLASDEPGQPRVIGSSPNTD
jgi:thiamine biosynthesis lipoprotein